MVAEIKRNFHARIPTTHNKNFLSPVTLTGFIIAGVDNFATKFTQPVDLRHHPLRILSGSHHQPLAEILDLAYTASGFHGLHPPQTARIVVLSGLHALVELWDDVEAFCVALQVVDELPLRRILWVVIGEWEFGQLAELFWEMKLQAVVCPLLPQRGNAVGPFEDYERDAMFFQAGGHRQARWAGADNDWAVNPDTPA
ncbi:hypothetical protein OROHE_005292 [Orobanche hederae]